MPPCSVFSLGVAGGSAAVGHGPAQRAQLGKHRPGRAGDGKPAVGIADPLHGELTDAIALLDGPQDDLNVEHEAVRDALAIQLSGHVAPVDLEAALGIGRSI
jgi:hypothetical protein